MEEQKLISGLYLSWAQGTALYARYAETRRVSYSELMVLYALSEGEALTQREVSLRCELTKQTVNQVVKKFREAGWLVLTGDAADRRRKVITLTEAGARQAEAVAGPLRAMEARVGRRVGWKRLAAMKETSDRFNRYFAEELARLSGKGDA